MKDDLRIAPAPVSWRVIEVDGFVPAVLHKPGKREEHQDTVLEQQFEESAEAEKG